MKATLLSHYALSDEEYHAEIGKALSRGQPVAIKYNMGIFTKSGKKGNHISVVTARRWKNGQCQYKIRNSWGNSCNYRSDIECIAAEGAFWVNAQEFYDNKILAYYLTKRKILPWDVKF